MGYQNGERAGLHLQGTLASWRLDCPCVLVILSPAMTQLYDQDDDTEVCQDGNEDFSNCDGDVTYAPDPYLYDLYNDATPVWLCDKHAGLRAEEL